MATWCILPLSRTTFRSFPLLGREAFKKELSKYKGGKGTIQFPIDEPIPFDLMQKIVKYRVKENLGKKKN
jgi:uncharacterized protein YdhG (YjbR/CyaY superfamily)